MLLGLFLGLVLLGMGWRLGWIRRAELAPLAELAGLMAALWLAGTGAFLPAAVALGAVAASWLARRPRPSGRPGPSPAEAAALQLLRLEPGASDAAIRTAHRARILAAHPDRGAPDIEAARLNAARDLLLARRR